MHALTRSMSGMYCWQSRIASGSQAARCCGVHCCAAAGKDANVSARQKAAEKPATTRRFRRAVQTLIVESVLSIAARHLENSDRSVRRSRGQHPSISAGHVKETDLLRTRPVECVDRLGCRL